MAEFLQTLNPLACPPLWLQSFQKVATQFTVCDDLLQQGINNHQQRMAQSHQTPAFCPVALPDAEIGRLSTCLWCDWPPKRPQSVPDAATGFPCSYARSCACRRSRYCPGTSPPTTPNGPPSQTGSCPYGHLLHALLSQPIRQGEQVAGHGPERPHRLMQLTSRIDATHVRDHGLLVNIESSTTTAENVHVRLGVGPSPGGHRQNTTVYPACSPTFGGDSFGFEALSRPPCSAGSKQQVKIGLHPEPRPQSNVVAMQPIFIVSGCGAAACPLL